MKKEGKKFKRSQTNILVNILLISIFIVVALIVFSFAGAIIKSKSSSVERGFENYLDMLKQTGIESEGSNVQSSEIDSGSSPGLDEKNQSINVTFDNVVIDCGIISAPGTYVLLKDISSNSSCLNVTADDVIIDCNFKAINFVNSGIFLNGNRNNIIIRNCNLNSKDTYSRGISGISGPGIYNNLNISNNNIFITGDLNYGIYIFKSNNGKYAKNNISLSGRMIHVGYSNYDIIDSNNLNGLNQSVKCWAGIIFADKAEGSIVSNNNIYSYYGIFVTGSSNVSIFDNYIVSDIGIYFSISSSSCTVKNNTLASNILDLWISKRIKSVDDLNIVDQKINTYYFYNMYGKAHNISFINSDYGKISLSGINYTIERTENNLIRDLNSDVVISNNYAFINSTKAQGLNTTAIITLYNVPAMPSPIILKNREICPKSTCNNLTSLSSANVSFNVSGWDKYSIGSISGDVLIENCFNDKLNPIPICTCSDLQKISQKLDGNFEIQNDIECYDTINWNNGAGFEPLGTGFEPIKSFSGMLDGRGHSITNLFINSSDYYVGLFRYSRGEIKNLGLINSYVSGDSVVGGLVGGIVSGQISNCYSDGTFIAGANLGALVGMVWGGTILNSYSSGTVAGSGNIGGLVGSFSLGGKINNCYSIADMKGTGATIGGLVGYSQPGALISNSYFTDANHNNKLGILENKDAFFGSSHAVYSNSTNPWDSKIWEFNKLKLPVLKPFGIFSYSFSNPECFNVSLNPIPICTCSDLQKISQKLDGNFEIQNDIDCSETKEWNLNISNSPEGFISIGNSNDEFKGTLNGKGFDIRNIYGGSLFRYLSGNVIGVNLRNINITNGGAIASSNSGNIINCSAIGTVSGAGPAFSTAIELGFGRNCLSIAENESFINGGGTGGLVGNHFGSIQNSYFKGDVYGENLAGGIAGNVDSGKIIDSYTDAEVNGKINVGGIAGQTHAADIINCYSIGTVTGSSTVGGIIGFAGGISIINNSFSAAIVYGTSLGGGIAGTIGGIEHTWFGGDCKSIIENSYFYSGNCTGYGGEIGCAPINHTPYFYIVRNDPLIKWDFTKTWSDVNNYLYYPIFKNQLIKCTPNCEDRECGGDGCGGVCGNCSDNLECSDSYKCEYVFEKKLIAHYSLEGNARDLSGLDNDGFISGATETKGQFGNAYYFNGESDAITIEDSQSLDPETISISIWVNPSKTNDFESPLMKTNSEWSDGYGFFYSDGKINFFVNGYVNNIGVDAKESEWINYVGTFNGSVMKLYENTALVASKEYNGKIMSSKSMLSIGRSSEMGPYAHYYGGSVDEIKLWNYELNEKEIKREYKKELFAYWKFNETIDNEFKDLASNHNMAKNENTEIVFDNIRGYVTEFNRADSGLAIQESTNINSPFTVNAWIKLKNQTLESDENIVVAVDSNDNQINILSLTKDGNYRAFSACESKPVLAEEWNYVTVSYDGERIELLINAEKICSANMSLPDIEIAVIGKSFNGYLGGLEIWNGVLSDWDILNSFGKTSCQLLCIGKECGTNECGGSCGTCNKGVCSEGKCTVIPGNYILYYPFTINDPEKTYDYSGNNYHGIVNGSVLWTPLGYIRGAYDFHSGFIDSNKSMLSKQASFSARFRVNSESLKSAIISESENNMGYSLMLYKENVSVYNESDDTTTSQMKFFISCQDQFAQNGTQTELYSIDPGKWYNAICIYDGDFISMYVDKWLVSVVDASCKENISDCHPDLSPSFKIGYEKGIGYFKGEIDEVKVWNRTLSTDEIRAESDYGACSSIEERDPLTGDCHNPGSARILASFDMDKELTDRANGIEAVPFGETEYSYDLDLEDIFNIKNGGIKFSNGLQLGNDYTIGELIKINSIIGDGVLFSDAPFVKIDSSGLSMDIPNCPSSGKIAIGNQWNVLTFNSETGTSGDHTYFLDVISENGNKQSISCTIPASLADPLPITNLAQIGPMQGDISMIGLTVGQGDFNEKLQIALLRLLGKCPGSQKLNPYTQECEDTCYYDSGCESRYPDDRTFCNRNSFGDFSKTKALCVECLQDSDCLKYMPNTGEKIQCGDGQCTVGDVEPGCIISSALPKFYKLSIKGTKNIRVDWLGPGLNLDTNCRNAKVFDGDFILTHQEKSSWEDYDIWVSDLDITNYDCQNLHESIEGKIIFNEVSKYAFLLTSEGSCSPEVKLIDSKLLNKFAYSYNPLKACGPGPSNRPCREWIPHSQYISSLEWNFKNKIGFGGPTGLFDYDANYVDFDKSIVKFIPTAFGGGRNVGTFTLEGCSGANCCTCMECKTDSDCPQDQKCGSGKCEPECITDEECFAKNNGASSGYLNRDKIICKNNRCDYGECKEGFFGHFSSPCPSGQYCSKGRCYFGEKSWSGKFSCNKYDDECRGKVMSNTFSFSLSGPYVNPGKVNMVDGICQDHECKELLASKLYKNNFNGFCLDNDWEFRDRDNEGNIFTNNVKKPVCKDNKKTLSNGKCVCDERKGFDEVIQGSNECKCKESLVEGPDGKCTCKNGEQLYVGDGKDLSKAYCIKKQEKFCSYPGVSQSENCCKPKNFINLGGESFSIQVGKPIDQCGWDDCGKWYGCDDIWWCVEDPKTGIQKVQVEYGICGGDGKCKYGKRSDFAIGNDCMKCHVEESDKCYYIPETSYSTQDSYMSFSSIIPGSSFPKQILEWKIKGPVENAEFREQGLWHYPKKIGEPCLDPGAKAMLTGCIGIEKDSPRFKDKLTGCSILPESAFECISSAQLTNPNKMLCAKKTIDVQKPEIKDKGEKGKVSILLDIDYNEDYPDIEDLSILYSIEDLEENVEISKKTGSISELEQILTEMQDLSNTIGINIMTTSDPDFKKFNLVMRERITTDIGKIYEFFGDNKISLPGTVVIDNIFGRVENGIQSPTPYELKTEFKTEMNGGFETLKSARILIKSKNNIPYLYAPPEFVPIEKLPTTLTDVYSKRTITIYQLFELINTVKLNGNNIEIIPDEVKRLNSGVLSPNNLIYDDSLSLTKTTRNSANSAYDSALSYYNSARMNCYDLEESSSSSCYLAAVIKIIGIYEKKGEIDLAIKKIDLIINDAASPFYSDKDIKSQLLLIRAKLNILLSSFRQYYDVKQYSNIWSTKDVKFNGGCYLAQAYRDMLESLKIKPENNGAKEELMSLKNEIYIKVMQGLTGQLDEGFVKLDGEITVDKVYGNLVASNYDLIGEWQKTADRAYDFKVGIWALKKIDDNRANGIDAVKFMNMLNSNGDLDKKNQYLALAKIYGFYGAVSAIPNVNFNDDFMKDQCVQENEISSYSANELRTLANYYKGMAMAACIPDIALILGEGDPSKAKDLMNKYKCDTIVINKIGADKLPLVNNCLNYPAKRGYAYESVMDPWYNRYVLSQVNVFNGATLALSFGGNYIVHGAKALRSGLALEEAKQMASRTGADVLVQISGKSGATAAEAAGKTAVKIASGYTIKAGVSQIAKRFTIGSVKFLGKFGVGMAEFALINEATTGILETTGVERFYARNIGLIFSIGTVSLIHMPNFEGAMPEIKYFATIDSANVKTIEPKIIFRNAEQRAKFDQAISTNPEYANYWVKTGDNNYRFTDYNREVKYTIEGKTEATSPATMDMKGALTKDIRGVPSLKGRDVASAIDSVVNSGASGGQCFLSGTEIKMPDGTYKNIEDLKTGESVVAYDIANKKAVESSITATFVRPETKYRELTYEIFE